MEDWFRQGPTDLPALPIEGTPPTFRAPIASAAPQPLVPAVSAAARPHVSLSMIVKNEEANLPHCLGSIADLVDEIVIADTGSTDRTREIAARFGARIVDFPWQDSFGAARNASLAHATGKWIFWLDGDDRIDAENRAKLKTLFSRLGDEMDAYVVKIRSSMNESQRDAKLLDQVRLYRNHPQIRWQYRIHEQILPAVNKLGGDVRWTDVIIDHVGYQDLDVRRRKLLRNLRLLELEDVDHPNDPFTLFNLGWTTLDLGRPSDALPFLQRSLELSSPSASIVRKLHVLLIHTHLCLNSLDNALQVCQMGRERFPEDAELLFEEASMMRQKGNLAQAEKSLHELIHLRSSHYFASVDAGLRTHRARHLLGTVYREQQKWIEAEVQLRAVVTETPDFTPAWLSLGDLYLDQTRFPMVDKVVAQLETLGVVLEARVLQARAHLGRKDHAGARRLLETVVEQFPNAPGPWVLLSHVLLSEGKDWQTAEAVLRKILTMNPANVEARHNLDVLLRQYKK